MPHDEFLIRIKPADVLLFRYPRPFDRDHHVARTTLPLPQTVAGALRAKLYAEYVEKSPHGKEAKRAEELVRPGEEEPGFEIIGIFFAKSGTLYFPAPADIARDKSGDIFPVKPWTLKIGGEELTLLKGRNIHFESVEGYLSTEGLLEYLLGNPEKAISKLAPQEELYTSEERIGIKVGPKRTVEEHFFYRVEFLRLRKDVEILVWAKGEELRNLLPERGIIKLGGEGRFAAYEVTDGSEIQRILRILKELEGKLMPKLREQRKAKAYVVTPLLGELKIGEVVAQILRKPVLISGWDMRRGKPKGVRYGISPGSVFFIKDTAGISRPWLKSGRLRKLGYGLVFWGVW